MVVTEEVKKEAHALGCFEIGESNLAGMEGSMSRESDAVFESVMNLNPQLFFNEVLNTVDDFVLDTFDFYFQ